MRRRLADFHLAVIVFTRLRTLAFDYLKDSFGTKDIRGISAVRCLEATPIRGLSSITTILNISGCYEPGARKNKAVVREKSRLSLKEWRQWCTQWWRVESQSEKFKDHSGDFSD